MIQKEAKPSEKMRVLDMHAHLSCLTEETQGSAQMEANTGKRAEMQNDKPEDMSIENGERLDEVRRAAAWREIEQRRLDGVRTFFSCGTPKEWAFVQELRSRKELLFSFGIHPWYAADWEADKYIEAFRACDAVGEIGMDSVWCSVPLSVQRRQFATQLEIAADLGKPIVLHTKGQEREIEEMIRDFPHSVCVHWYSGDEESLERFMEQGCYFTLGPDLTYRCRGAEGQKRAQAMQAEDHASDMAEQEHLWLCAERAAGEEQARLYGRMVREIPADRLFLETDGISAVAWALGSGYTGIDKISQVLHENAAYLAEIKNMKKEELCRRMERNLENFLYDTDR